MKRLPMRKIREALRLRADGLSGRQMALGLSLGRATVSDYLRRADVAGLSWPLPADLSDGDIERLLFPRTAGDVCGSYPQPDWAYMHGELRRKGVTLSLLWEEYRAVHPDGYGYSRFCELYTRWEGKLSPVMRQRHPAGERLFVDYAGANGFIGGVGEAHSEIYRPIIWGSAPLPPSGSAPLRRHQLEKCAQSAL